MCGKKQGDFYYIEPSLIENITFENEERICWQWFETSEMAPNLDPYFLIYTAPNISPPANSKGFRRFMLPVRITHSPTCATSEPLTPYSVVTPLAIHLKWPISLNPDIANIPYGSLPQASRVTWSSISTHSFTSTVPFESTSTFTTCQITDIETHGSLTLTSTKNLIPQKNMTRIFLLPTSRQSMCLFRI